MPPLQQRQSPFSHKNTTHANNNSSISSSNKSVFEFVLENELPSLDAAVQRGEESLQQLTTTRDSDNSNCSCGCSHLLSLFPNQLCLELIPKQQILPPPRTVFQNNTGIDSTSQQQQLSYTYNYYLKDPISALHLQSQLETDGSIHTMILPATTHNHSNTGNNVILYGEEQERWNAIRTEGIPDLYHPYIVPTTATTSVADDEIHDVVVVVVAANDASGTDTNNSQYHDNSRKRHKTSDPINPTATAIFISNTDVTNVPQAPLPSPPRLGMNINRSSRNSSKNDLFSVHPTVPPPSPITSTATTTTTPRTTKPILNMPEGTLTTTNTDTMAISTTTTTTFPSSSPSLLLFPQHHRPLPPQPRSPVTAVRNAGATNETPLTLPSLTTTLPSTTITNSAIVLVPISSMDVDDNDISNNSNISPVATTVIQDRITTTAIAEDSRDNNPRLLSGSPKTMELTTSSGTATTTTTISTPLPHVAEPTVVAAVLSESKGQGEGRNNSNNDPQQREEVVVAAQEILLAPTTTADPNSLKSNNEVPPRQPSQSTTTTTNDDDLMQVEQEQLRHIDCIPSKNSIVVPDEDETNNAVFLLSDQAFVKYYQYEEQIVFLQQNLLSTKRLPSSKNKKSSSTGGSSHITLSGIQALQSTMIMTATAAVGGGSYSSNPQQHVSSSILSQTNGNRILSSLPDPSTSRSDNVIQSDPRMYQTATMAWYHDKQCEVMAYSKLLMENFVRSRRTYWFNQKRNMTSTTVSSIVKNDHPQSFHSTRPRLFRSNLTPNNNNGMMLGFGWIISNDDADDESTHTKEVISSWEQQPYSDYFQQPQSSLSKMQCLECSFSGYIERSDTTTHSIRRTNQPHGQHSIQHHFLRSNHKFGVTCEARPRIYCFHCTKYMHHEIFANEQLRIDVAEILPWMAWNDHGGIHRSFDALQFVNLPDIGVVWKGMKATYPIIAPKEHIRASQICLDRYMMFHGETGHLPRGVSSFTVEFTKQQQLLSQADRYFVSAPVGIYNLGNTCFMSAILHCLIHCTPLQRYFIHDVGHNHVACTIYRTMNTKIAADTSAKLKAKMKSVCLACEVDKLFLRYMGSTRGIDLLSIVDTSSLHSTSKNVDLDTAISINNIIDAAIDKGSPLLTADMLTAAWKCGGMNHLAGYEQRDAHEFLHGFLEILGKHMRQFRDRVQTTINSIQPSKSIKRKLDVKRGDDEIKNLFEGSLRSVLVCLECGSKRIQSETFMSISLPLSKEGHGATGVTQQNLDIETCLQHFTMPEMLTDPVMCPKCERKTPTKKQHVVSKLPKVLCLHLKRFDAASNKKIEDFVSFPCHGLNMGPFLPHWCEVTRVQSVSSQDSQEHWSAPEIKYDLYATVNHFGNLQSGHYVSNVQVKNRWFHCNDSFVGFASEAEILRSEGAYLLFYIRR